MADPAPLGQDPPGKTSSDQVCFTDAQTPKGGATPLVLPAPSGLDLPAVPHVSFQGCTSTEAVGGPQEVAGGGG